MGYVMSRIFIKYAFTTEKLKYLSYGSFYFG